MTNQLNAVRGSTFESVGDDALLLHEFSHRTGNEIAAAAAALHLAKRASPGTGSRLLAQAADRLDAFAELHRILARPVRSKTEVSSDLAAVCRAIVAGADCPSSSAVSLEVPTTWLNGQVARRLVIVAAELVRNAVRHALEGRAGRLVVSLEILGDHVVLQVTDDGPGMRASSGTSGTGLGSGIVRQLVERAGGVISIGSDRRGTSVCVSLPLLSDGGDDDAVPF